MIEISSLTNDIVKETVKLQQKKYREETGLFLLEGFKAIEEAINYGIRIIKIFLKNPEDLKIIPTDVEIIKTSETVLKKISTTDSAPAVVAVGIQRKITKDWIKNAKKIILLEGIKDAGNFGTILRSASAFGIDGIILYKDTIDIYNPKCVRSSAGNLWKNKISHMWDFTDLRCLLKDFPKIGTLPKSNDSILLNDFVFPEKYCIFFGSEADGLSRELKSITDKNLTIEMHNSVESLNLGVSASIIMYKARSL